MLCFNSVMTFGEMSEWLKETVSKTVIPGNWYLGFESLSLRFLPIRTFLDRVGFFINMKQGNALNVLNIRGFFAEQSLDKVKLYFIIYKYVQDTITRETIL